MAVGGDASSALGRRTVFCSFSFSAYTLTQRLNDSTLKINMYPRKSIPRGAARRLFAGNDVIAWAPRIERAPTKRNPGETFHVTRYPFSSVLCTCWTTQL